MSASDDEESLNDLDQAIETDSDGEIAALAVSALPNQTLNLSINNERALLQKLDQISLFSNKKLSFLESLVVPDTKKQVEDFEPELAINDLERENKFVEYATNAVHAGLKELRSRKIKFRRPLDYFAEMVKSDKHMQRIKTRLIKDKNIVQGAQRRKNERLAKKQAKRVQGEKEQQRKSSVKQQMEAITKLRKERVKKRSEAGKGTKIGEDGMIRAGDSDDDFPVDLLDVEEIDPSVFVKAGLSKRTPHKGVKGSYGARGSGGIHKGRGGIVKKQRGPKKRLGKRRRAQVRSRASKT